MESKSVKNTKTALPDEYQQGFCDFLGCKIDLSQRVLIPRPETEFMVRYAIRDFVLQKSSPRVLDIFSGSGCAGIAVAKNIPRAAVDFSDIDPKAVSQIKINLKLNGIEKERTRVFLSDIFEKLPPNAKYDAILANPPYVDPARIDEVQDSVLDYEPHHALFGGAGGLEVIARFLRRAKDFLKPCGSVYMEFDAQQAEPIRRILDNNGYNRYNFLRDQFGQVRFVKIGVLQ